MLAFVLSVLVVSAPAVDSQVRAGLAAFDELRYREAVRLLDTALKNPALTRDDSIAALGALARSHAVLHHDPQARQAFLRVLELDPAYLVGYDETPTVTQSFQAAREEYERTHPPVVTAITAPVVVAPKLKPVWPWIVGGAAVVAASVVTVVLLTRGDDEPSGVSDVWLLP